MTMEIDHSHDRVEVIHREETGRSVSARIWYDPGFEKGGLNVEMDGDNALLTVLEARFFAAGLLALCNRLDATNAFETAERIREESRGGDK